MSLPEKIDRGLLGQYTRSRRAGGARQYLKQRANRLDRHRAHRDPEAPSTYRAYRGWML